MPLYIYNTLTRKKGEFVPLKKGAVGMYVCGPTVYDQPHIGHARAAYIFEVVRNYFEYCCYKVNFARNITDVDDKIIAKAKEELPQTEINEAVKEIAEKYTRIYREDMKALGLKEPTYEPSAIGHISDMQDYIRVLIEKKFAYVAEGNVYFEVRRFKDYGMLSHQNLDQMQSAVRIEKDENKKDPLDFALWKKVKEDEPSWRSPWGKGRPGWHIECSVMSSKYLGDEFDIHAGGCDLIFPHHENEIAQSQSYNQKKFARIWMHNGLLTINGQKMAKSLGNFISIKDFLSENIEQVLKFFFLSCHYRSPIDYNKERIEEAKKTYERFEIFYNKLDELPSKAKAIRNYSQKQDKKILEFEKNFKTAMDDDFNTAKALAILFDLVSFCNKLLSDNKDENKAVLESAKKLFQDFCSIFAVSFKQKPKGKLAEKEIEKLIRARSEFRKKGKFAEADNIRKDLEQKGVILEDTKESTIWRRKI